MEKSEIKNTGATFTPPELANFIANKILHYACDLDSPKIILDPACGDGELLYAYINSALGRHSISQCYGYDTNNNYIQDAKSKLNGIIDKDRLYLEEIDFLTICKPKDLFNTTTEIADIVIANPPYVRTKNIGAEKSQKIAKDFNLTGKIDLYYPFIIGMTNLLKDGGVIGFITSNKYLFNKSGEKVREFLLDNYEILEVIDLGDTKLFKAAVLPAIFIGRKTKSPNKNASKFSKIYEVAPAPEDSSPKESIYDILDETNSGLYSVQNKAYKYDLGILPHPEVKTNIWHMISFEEKDWVDKVNRNSSFFIGDKFNVKVGIKSCADEVFLKNTWDEEDIPEDIFIKPLISQENIKAWSISDNTQTVIYPHYSHNGKRQVYDIEKYPNAKKFFEKHRDILAARKYVIDAGRKWYEMWVPQDPASWTLPKLIFPDISLEPRFSYDEKGAIVNGNCYWISANNEEEKELLLLIQGICNSELMTKYHDLCFNNKLYSGRRRYFTQYIEKYPIPQQDSVYAKKIKEIATVLNNNNLPPNQIQSLTTELNLNVNKAFGF